MISANEYISDFRTDLNNLANKFRLDVRYEESVSGPRDAEIWSATVTGILSILLINYKRLKEKYYSVRGVPYGIGNASKKGDARESAAYMALVALNNEGYTM